MSTNMFDQTSSNSNDIKYNIVDSGFNHFNNGETLEDPILSHVNIKETLEKMSNGFQPKLINPFNDPNFAKSREDKFKDESNEFHSMIRATMIKDNGDDLDSLAHQLRQNAGFNDYKACLKLVSNPRFLEFCDMKDPEGFNAMNYSVTYGHNDISKMLLDAGAEPDSKNLADFINIGNTDDLMSSDMMDDGILQSVFGNIKSNVKNEYESNLIKKYGSISEDHINPITGELLVDYNEMRSMEGESEDNSEDKSKDKSEYNDGLMNILKSKKCIIRKDMIGKRLFDVGRTVAEADFITTNPNFDTMESDCVNESNLTMKDFKHMGKVDQEMLIMGLAVETISEEEIESQRIQWSNERKKIKNLMKEKELEMSNTDQVFSLSSQPNQIHQLPTTKTEKVERNRVLDGFEENFKKRTGAKNVFGVTDRFNEYSFSKDEKESIHKNSFYVDEISMEKYKSIVNKLDRNEKIAFVKEILRSRGFKGRIGEMEIDALLYEHEKKSKESKTILHMCEGNSPLFDNSQNEIIYNSGDKIAIPFSQIGRICETKKKETNGSFSKNFASAMKKNFINNGFSEDRPITKISVPEGTQVTPEQIEEMMSKMNFDSYAIRNNEFLEKYSARDVSKLLIVDGNIDINLVEHRNRMLPPPPHKEDLKLTVRSTLKAQIGYISNKKINDLVDSLFDKLIFYRNMFRRLAPINNVDVRKSPIHGQGIFATKQIKKGEIITFYFPYFLEHVYKDSNDTSKENEGIILVPIISRRDFNLENNGELLAMRRGAIKIDKDFYLVGDDQYIADHRFLGHLVNDPCDFSKGKIDSIMYEQEIIQKANSSVISYDKDRRFIYLSATKTIEIDEEVLVPYGCRYWEIDETPLSAYDSEPTPSGKNE
jgi:hypothetical protein